MESFRNTSGTIDAGWVARASLKESVDTIPPAVPRRAAREHAHGQTNERALVTVSVDGGPLTDGGNKFPPRLGNEPRGARGARGGARWAELKFRARRAARPSDHRNGKIRPTIMARHGRLLFGTSIPQRRRLLFDTSIPLRRRLLTDTVADSEIVWDRRLNSLQGSGLVRNYGIAEEKNRKRIRSECEPYATAEGSVRYEKERRCGTESSVRTGTEFKNGTVVDTASLSGVSAKGVARIELKNSTQNQSESDNDIGIKGKRTIAAPPALARRQAPREAALAQVKSLIRTNFNLMRVLPPGTSRLT
ncbi:hypothetical protein EVAR_76726_1 [Eumeta japonica]|uniref:Uncharacterized protein n=1 Tax=Eumeta variegata TaxID=151549 RepID=A0A4C1STM7_EUMVA|nr:hypothetical protein EVAR_76726_1 [Eumeta japonica]